MLPLSLILKPSATCLHCLPVRGSVQRSSRLSFVLVQTSANFSVRLQAGAAAGASVLRAHPGGRHAGVLARVAGGPPASAKRTSLFMLHATRLWTSGCGSVPDPANLDLYRPQQTSPKCTSPSAQNSLPWYFVWSHLTEQKANVPEGLTMLHVGRLALMCSGDGIWFKDRIFR